MAPNNRRPGDTGHERDALRSKPGEEPAPESGAKQGDESGQRTLKAREPMPLPQQKKPLESSGVAADRPELPKTPVWRYTFSAPLARERVSVPSMLREWHAAMKFGLELSSLEIDGESVEADALLLLNAWISQYSAWNASKQDHFAAWERLERVLRAKSPLVLKRLKSSR